MQINGNKQDADGGSWSVLKRWGIEGTASSEDSRGRNDIGAYKNVEIDADRVGRGVKSRGPGSANKWNLSKYSWRELNRTETLGNRGDCETQGFKVEVAGGAH